MEKKEQLYEGKAKKVYATEDPNLVIVSYKDDATALDGLKKGTIVGKGIINNRMTNRLMAKMEKAGIPTHFVKELSERDTLVKSLPVGWKQKLAFSVSIFHEPRIVFLDEPTGGVDPATRRQFWELIYQAADQGITVFVTTHYMDEAEYCNRISIMVDGQIKALDTPARLKQQFGAETMDDVFQKLARGAVRKAE